MATKGVEDFDLPLPSSSTVESESEPDIDPEERRYNENIEKLQEYVERMAYRPVKPQKASQHTEKLAGPKKVVILDNAEMFAQVYDPKERGERMRRMAGKYTALSTEQLECLIKVQQAKERRRENLLKRKQEIYYRMLTRLELQCRTQYLNVLIKKFADFISKLATNMRIPPQLVEPYARMQRAIFCNILLAIGVQPTSQAALSYNTPEGMQYEVAHRLAHAFLSLIIKALNTAANKDSEEVPNSESDHEMDNYIKGRLMCAAEKKILNQRKAAKAASQRDLYCHLKRCQTFPLNK